jgi:tetratricopeptide (TPR) repeat protein
MSRHFGREALQKLLQGVGSEEEATRALQHVAECLPCQSLAAGCLAQVRGGERGPVHPREARNAFALFLEAKVDGAIETLKAGSWWAEIRNLGPARQIKKIRSTAHLQSVKFFETVLADARATALTDPFLGESLVRTALVVVDLLPAMQVSRALKNDLRGQALTVVANCRRLAADFPGAATASTEAERFLAEGTGDPGLEAGLLSIRCSLCTDRGEFEEGLDCVHRAMEIFKDLEDWKAAAHNAVLKAGCLLAADRWREAIEVARFALKSMPPQELRLYILAKLIIAESLALLKRPHEALRDFMEARSLGEQADAGIRLQVLYVEAQLLDALGEAAISEKLFRHTVKVYFDQEVYKAAFRTLLTLFEAFCRRGARDKAIALCEEAIAAAIQAGEACNEQIRLAWEELLAVVRVRPLGESELIEARQHFVRNWSVPAGALLLPRVAPAGPAGEVEIPPPPPIQGGGEVLSGSFGDALAAYEKALTQAALRQADGNRTEACRLLRISRNTLMKRIQRYGL